MSCLDVPGMKWSRRLNLFIADRSLEWVDELKSWVVELTKELETILSYHMRLSEMRKHARHYRGPIEAIGGHLYVVLLSTAYKGLWGYLKSCRRDIVSCYLPWIQVCQQLQIATELKVCDC